MLNTILLMLKDSLVETIIAAVVMLLISGLGGYKVATAMRDETIAYTPDTYLVLAFLGWTVGILVGLLIAMWFSVGVLAPLLAGGLSGLVGSVGGLALSHVRYRKIQKAAKK